MRHGQSGVFEEDARDPHIQRRGPEFHGVPTRGVGGKTVEEFGPARGRRLPEQARQRRAVRPVTSSGRAQAAVEVDLDPRRPGGQLDRKRRYAPEVVVGDAHRAHRVGTRRPRPDLEQLIQGRLDGRRGIGGHLPVPSRSRSCAPAPKAIRRSSRGAASRAPGSRPRPRRRRWPCSCRSTPASSGPCDRRAARRSPCPSG